MEGLHTMGFSLVSLFFIHSVTHVTYVTGCSLVPQGLGVTMYTLSIYGYLKMSIAQIYSRKQCGDL
jgi:hypothetical protein